MKLAVINHLGRDPEQVFPDGAGEPSSTSHAPVNFHGYAACTQGVFSKRDDALPEGTDGVLLLVRHDLKSARQALIELRAISRLPVVVSLKECGLSQFAGTFTKAGKLQLFQDICTRADAAIATTEELLPIYRGAGARDVEFIPTPYPIEDARWDFSYPLEERRGVFLGTREFKVSARNHLAALLALKPFMEAMQEPVTVINTDGWRGRRLLHQLRYSEGLLNVVEGRLSYPDYLRLMARHKLVFQHDLGAVPGQVAGDALLCRMPCVGGNGATERQVFPELCGHGRSLEHLLELTARLLEHPYDCSATVSDAMERAQLRLSFTAVSARLDSFFSRFRR